MSKITIQADIEAPIKWVWEAYTEPEHIVNWNFATDDWQCPDAENDLRIGGKYRARMEAKDGSFGFDFEAIYEALDPGKSFSYRMPDGREVKVIFEANGDQTRMTILFDPENENPMDMQQAGWQMILDNFRKYAENL